MSCLCVVAGVSWVWCVVCRELVMCRRLVVS